MDEPTRDHGPQPLDGLLDRWKISNHYVRKLSELFGTEFIVAHDQRRNA